MTWKIQAITGELTGQEISIDRDMLVGRHQSADIVLQAGEISRKHAAFLLKDQALWLQDLNSSNGTFVNGEKIKKARLKEGDRILIGTSIVKLVTVDPATAMSEADARQQLEKRGQQQALKTQTTNRAMSGSIEEIPLPDLLQLFSTSKRTGVLTLKGPQGQGEIYLRKGQIYYASIDDSYDLSPMKAAYRILTWERGNFELDSSEGKTVLEEIKESTEGLLMEGMRLLDEFKHIESKLPQRKAPLQIPRPLNPPLNALKPVELDVFQIVLNGGTTQTVLDKAKLSDVERKAAAQERDVDLFVAGGGGTFTMEVIAAEAGYSRSAIYRQFANRQELLAALVQRTTQRHMLAMLQMVDADATPVDLLINSLVKAGAVSGPTIPIEVARRLEELNRLIGDHNRYYPMERNLPVDPCSGQLLDMGEPWRPLPTVTIDTLREKARAG